MKYIIILLFTVSMCFAQNKTLTEFPFSSADTIGAITSHDSVDVQMGKGGQWKLLTQSINDTAWVTPDDKAAEQIVQFMLAAETYWTQIKDVRFRIRAAGVDTITSNWVRVGQYNGSFTLDVKPDTAGTNTYYFDTELHGN